MAVGFGILAMLDNITKDIMQINKQCRNTPNRCSQNMLCVEKYLDVSSACNVDVTLCNVMTPTQAVYAMIYMPHTERPITYCRLRSMRKHNISS